METMEQALIKAYGPNSRRAVTYSYVMKRILDSAKAPGFGDEAWAPLGELVDIAAFARMGNFMEVVDWNQYVPLLSMWSKATDWTFHVRRVTEGEDYAVLELHETAGYPDRDEDYNSISVYQFGQDGRLVHLDVYLQKREAPEASRRHSWDLAKVGART
ncbi:hypothetical protein [Novosphingobium album (ex Liu et al. 2023)]|uniref:SnoaL-like domain-containing protein n=1 Tax=Novosphingobium album (ex Liu et al. 2023) TaxID=3031130 RepID=A0ABT5WJN7_9SPHN|nr:hypothetical protein [Novosphingobium album (ex Liu et al. 2023)]MDE8650260.1 hypothetical protein [Novosphingobium album (ex Liu et al. 2023)]